MGLSLALGFLALVGLALGLTFRRTRLIGMTVFLISVVILVAGAYFGL